MKLCIPANEDQGLESPVSEHFGSAKLFVIVDTGSGAFRAVPNRNLHQGHGMCQPLRPLSGEQVDGIAVGGIGMGALGKLLAAGIKVYITRERTVGETVTALNAGTLREATPAAACSRHGHGHGHGGTCH